MPALTKSIEATTFQVGTTYGTTSICDSECLFTATIISRTAKTVKIELHGEIVKRGISLWDGVETFAPFGRYSMSPTIKANRVPA